MTFTQWLRAIWIGSTIVSILVLLSGTGRAGELYLEGGLGFSHFPDAGRPYDGTWRQDGLNGANAFTRNDKAFRVGVGWRFDEHWAIAASLASAGATKFTSRFVGEQDYDEHAHKCVNLPACAGAREYKGSDAIRIYDATVSYTVPLDKWRPYVKVGGAVVTHRFTIQPAFGMPLPQLSSYGWFPALAVGGGICRQMIGKASICLDNVYYMAVNGGMSSMREDDFPLAKHINLTTVGVQVGLW